MFLSSKVQKISIQLFKINLCWYLNIFDTTDYHYLPGVHLTDQNSSVYNEQYHITELCKSITQHDQFFIIVAKKHLDTKCDSCFLSSWFLNALTQKVLKQILVFMFICKKEKHLHPYFCIWWNLKVFLKVSCE